MLTYSSRYPAAIQQSSAMNAVAKVYTAGEGTELETLSIVTGSVTIDYTSINRRSCQLIISDPQRKLVPKSPTDILAPYGNEMVIKYGPIYSDGSQELFSMGVFRIAEVDVDDAGNQVTITINAYDRSKQIQRQALTDIYTIAAGTNYGQAIQGLLSNRMPSLTFNMSPTSETTPLIVLDINQDPWQAASDMANAIGMDLFFDENGIVVMRPIPDPTTLASSWTYTDGQNSMIIELKNTYTAKKVYNHIIVTGETVSSKVAPVSASASDTNPNSPTYVNGPFGDIPLFIKSKIVTTTSQAQAMADRELAINLGQSNPISILGPANPAQDVQDVITATRLVDGVNSNYTIDKVLFNLDVTNTSKMEIDARSVA